MSGKLLHDSVHIIQIDFSILIFIEQSKTKLIFLVDIAMLIYIHDSAELLKGDMLVSVLVSQFEYSVRQEWVRALTEEAEENSKLRLVHELDFLHVLEVLL